MPDGVTDLTESTASTDLPSGDDATAATGGTSAARALAGLRVLDVSEHISGQYCARLMADAGADVTLVEPVTGTITRSMGPFWTEGTRPDDSVLFWHLNTAKLSVTLDWRTETGRRLFAELAADAEVIITAGGDVPPVPAAQSAKPSAEPIVCRVEEFASGEALAGWAGSELIHQALSGVMNENGAAGAEPLYGVGRRGYYAAGTVAYVSVLARLLGTGDGGVIGDPRVAVAETTAAMNYNRGTQYWYNGSRDVRGDPRTPRMTLRCRDGWVVAFPTQRHWAATCRVFRSPELAERTDLADEAGRLDRWREIGEIFQRHVADCDRDEVLAEAQRRRVVVARVADPDDLRGDAHLAERGYWQALDDADGRTRTALGPLFRFSPMDGRNLHRPPRLGEHTWPVLRDLGVDRQEYALLRNCLIV